MLYQIPLTLIHVDLTGKFYHKVIAFRYYLSKGMDKEYHKIKSCDIEEPILVNLSRERDLQNILLDI